MATNEKSVKSEEEDKKETKVDSKVEKKDLKNDIKKETPDLKDVQAAIQAEDNIRMDELLRGYRVLYLNKEHFLTKLFQISSIRIYDKSLLRVSKYGDQEFTRERNRSIRDGDYLTYKEQMKALKDRDVWSEEHEARLYELKDEADELIKKKDKLFSKIKATKDTALIGKLNKEVNKLGDDSVETHNNLLDMLAIQINYFKDTIEMRAQMRQQMGWIVSAVCENDGDDKYNSDKTLWKNVEDLEDVLKDADLSVLLSECTDYWNVASVDSQSFFGESPEDLKHVSDGEVQKS